MTYAPRVIVTAKLKSYGAYKRELLPGAEHRQHRYLNNRAENSHQTPDSGNDTCNGSNPLDRPNGVPLRLWSHRPTFPSASHRLTAPAYRQEMRNRFQLWQEITVSAIAA